MLLVIADASLGPGFQTEELRGLATKLNEQGAHGRKNRAAYQSTGFQESGLASASGQDSDAGGQAGRPTKEQDSSNTS